MSPRRRLSRVIEKNAEEARALVTGRMPGFVLGRDLAADEVPVFVFHDVRPATFERQLRHLERNAYETIDGDTFLEPTRGRRRVLLTFDDATWTFAAYAVPLLRRYGCRAVVFAIPGLVPVDDRAYPTLEDADAGRASIEEVDARARVQPLVTRRELLAMHESGIVDVQSHSMTHQRVPVGPVVEDFVHPGFDTDAYANVRIPLSIDDDPCAPARVRRLGAPVFRSASRLAGRRRFVEARGLVDALTERVCLGGDGRFFDRAGWRDELERTLASWPEPARGAYESEEETEAAVRAEIADSARTLQAMLPGKRIRHLCYPWFQGSALADHLAAEEGYAATYYGLLAPESPVSTLRTVARVSEAYLERLPGEGRRSIGSIWRAKLSTRGRKRHRAR